MSPEPDKGSQVKEHGSEKQGKKFNKSTEITIRYERFLLFVPFYRVGVNFFFTVG
jgi:hypothetical protein